MLILPNCKFGEYPSGIANDRLTFMIIKINDGIKFIFIVLLFCKFGIVDELLIKISIMKKLLLVAL